VNLLIDKLRIRQICQEMELSRRLGTETVLSPEAAAKLAGESDFCEMNRFNSYDCKLCKVIVASLGAYEKHSQSEMHRLNLEQY